MKQHQCSLCSHQHLPRGGQLLWCGLCTAWDPRAVCHSLLAAACGLVVRSPLPLGLQRACRAGVLGKYNPVLSMDLQTLKLFCGLGFWEPEYEALFFHISATLVPGSSAFL